MHIGQHNAYQWLVSDNFSINSLLKRSPEVLIGKYLVITAFDGGPLTPNPEEAKGGWIVYGSTLRSPVIPQ